MRKRIRRKKEKLAWVRSFGAFKASRRFVYAMQCGRLRRLVITVLHIPVASEVEDSIQLEKIPVSILP